MKKTAARICGHYIDNYFNITVRQFLERLLKDICYQYGIESVRPIKKRRDLEQIGLIDSAGELNVQNMFANIEPLYLGNKLRVSIHYEDLNRNIFRNHHPHFYSASVFNPEDIMELERIMNEKAAARERKYKPKRRHKCKIGLLPWHTSNRI